MSSVFIDNHDSHNETCAANMIRKVGQTIVSKCLHIYSWDLPQLFPRQWKSSSVKAIEDKVKKWADPTYYDRMAEQV